MKETEVLFALLRAGLTGETVSTQVQEACTEEMLQEIYRFAYSQKVVQIIAQALKKMQIPESTVAKAFQESVFKAFLRAGKIQHAYEGVCRVLEEGQIPFIPLKGSVLRQYYPEPWMRISADIDILVHPEDLEKANALLVEKLDFIFQEKGNHDISLRAPNGVLLELHFRMIERWKKTENILERVWDDAVPVRDGGYQYNMSNEMFCFFHIAHMAKHTAVGGCGLRPFIDLWIIDQHMPYDPEKLQELLEAGGWWKYYLAAEKLYKAWLCGGERDRQLQELETFILIKDAEHFERNKLVIDQQRKGGTKRYALQRIFLPYKHMKRYYPILEKHKWLTPFYEVVRWCKLLFGGGVKRSVEKLKTINSVDQEEYDAMTGLLEYLGMDLKEEFIKK